MREQEVRNLWEAYLEVCENQQLDEVSDELVNNAKNARIAATGAAYDAEMRDRTPENMRNSVRAGEKEASMKNAAAKRKKRINKEEVETWVNSLIEEGYDLSEYTWEEMYEAYKSLPDDKMIAKSNKFDKQYKTGPTKTDAEYKSTTDASRRRADTFLTTRFHDPEKSQQKSAANKNRPKSEKRSKTASNEKKFGNRLTRSDKQGIKDSYDLYDIILSHLLDEGYAETQEQAEVIMVNMSEEWRESIMEGNVSKKQQKKDAKTREKWYGEKSIERGTDRFSQLQKKAIESGKTKLF